MNDVTLGTLTTLMGIGIGFLGNYALEKFKARNETKKAIILERVASYKELWKLCEKNIDTIKQKKERLEQLKNWYFDGGGLMLSFKATDRFMGVKNLLEESTKNNLNEEQLAELKENLTWLRTEMKFEVGSYSRRQARRKLPNTKAQKIAPTF